jgi:hypothetical protein
MVVLLLQALTVNGTERIANRGSFRVAFRLPFERRAARSWSSVRPIAPLRPFIRWNRLEDGPKRSEMET